MRTANDLYQEALQLPEAERVHLADLLEASVDVKSIEQAWIDEARLRLDAIDRGEAKLLPWDQVKAELERKTRR